MGHSSLAVTLGYLRGLDIPQLTPAWGWAFELGVVSSNSVLKIDRGAANVIRIFRSRVNDVAMMHSLERKKVDPKGSTF